MSTASSQQVVHWQRTKRLMIIHLVIWFIFSFVIHWFAADTNKISFMHFPLGYYMAAQGSLIVFVVQLFFFSKQQDKIDRECGMAEAE
ncbi:MAG: DUF4212 domain-containing protein [Betaproteobacteria bacterium]|jgi:putative solute:sodium symporter small subunit|nr:DUF4212 domain-containing protein [Betaproteobacteria bacterium]